MTVTNYQERMQELGLALPIDPDAASRWRAAPRLDTLHDKVGGFLGNRKANADLLLRNIGERMAKEPGARRHHGRGQVRLFPAGRR